MPASPVIAVFGRDRATDGELAAARRFGAAVVRAGAVLLTGGTGTGAPEIKEQAIEGAVDADGAWIGVENADRRAAPRRARGGLVVSPGVGDRRNFVGACLCDLAVVLPGEDGTASELLFALALGRPVVLVGRPAEAIDALRNDARRRVPPSPRPHTPLDRAIATAYDAAPRTVPRSVALDAPADAVVGALLRHRTRPLDAGTLAGLRDERDWDAVISSRAAVLTDVGFRYPGSGRG